MADEIDDSNLHGDLLVSIVIMDPTNSREPKQPGGTVTKIELGSSIVRSITKVVIREPAGEAVVMEAC